MRLGGCHQIPDFVKSHFNPSRVKRCFITAETKIRERLTKIRGNTNRVVAAGFVFIACESGGFLPNATAEEAAKAEADAVVLHYREIVSASYQDSLTAAEALRARIGEFLAAPDENRFAAAREAWIAAHVAYSATEAYRFYEGPIDNGVNGVEARLNGWPMDEAYVDGVAEKPAGGIINDPEHYPWLDTTSLAELNARGGDKNIATGYHAIEFLLWGQDTDPDGPGTRSWKDYVASGDESPTTAPNPERRAKYLQSIADLLVQDLAKMIAEWDTENPEGYAKGFLQNAEGSSLARIFAGIARMAGDELAGERLFVGYDTGDQENEQSCFSDTTLLTLLGNADGIRNVYLGTYHDLKGPSPSELVRRIDPAADAAVQEAIAESRKAIEAIPAPLDRVITAKREDPVRQKLLGAVEGMEREGQAIVEAAAVLGIRLNFNSGGRDEAQ